MAIAVTQFVVGGTAENQKEVAKYSFPDTPAMYLNQITKMNSPSKAAAEAFHYSPQTSRGLTRGQISGYLNEYGPTGFNTLSSTEMSLLLSMGLAVAKGDISSDEDVNTVMKFMKVHASTVANRSGLITETDGNGVPVSSGGDTLGYSPQVQYGNGPVLGSRGPDPIDPSLLAKPPTVAQLLKDSFVDQSDNGMKEPSGDVGSQTQNGPTDGETVIEFKGTGLQNLDGPDPASLVGSDGGESAAAVQTDTRGLRARFRASAAYSGAFATWSASQ